MSLPRYLSNFHHWTDSKQNTKRKAIERISQRVKKENGCVFALLMNLQLLIGKKINK
jgi:hypothetical protein